MPMPKVRRVALGAALIGTAAVAAGGLLPSWEVYLVGVFLVLGSMTPVLFEWI